jgi:hypothetical protein
MGVVNTESQDEIARLENQLRQLQLGLQRTGGLLSGPDAPQGDEQAQMLQMMSSMQGQQAEAAQQLQGMGGDPMQQQMQGILMATQLGQDGEPDSTSSAEVRRLEQTLAGLQGGQLPQQRPQQPPFQPSMSAQNMGELYSAMAGGADDPAMIGNQYAQRMQYNDMLRNQYIQSRQVLTASERPRPVGGGYMDKEGYQVVPIWNPSTGKMTEQKLSQRFPDTIKIGDIPYVRNPMQQDIGAPDAFIPAQSASAAGQRQAAYAEEAELGGKRATSRQEAAELSADMALQDSRIQEIIFAPNFSESVGPFDTLIKKMGGAAMGGADSLLNRQVQILHNQLTTVQVADWKGAISNAELKFFHASVPDTTDHHQVWLDWYNDVFVPTKKFALLRAHGEVDFTNSNLSDYIKSGGWETGVTRTPGTDPYSQLLNDPEVQKALGN